MSGNGISACYVDWKKKWLLPRDGLSQVSRINHLQIGATDNRRTHLLGLAALICCTFRQRPLIALLNLHVFKHAV